LASRALASRERGEDQLVRVVDHRAGFVCFNRAIEIDRVPVALVGVVDHAANRRIKSTVAEPVRSLNLLIDHAGGI
jgi:hypothetical protein